MVVMMLLLQGASPAAVQETMSRGYEYTDDDIQLRARVCNTVFDE